MYGDARPEIWVKCEAVEEVEAKERVLLALDILTRYPPYTACEVRMIRHTYALFGRYDTDVIADCEWAVRVTESVDEDLEGVRSALAAWRDGTSRRTATQVAEEAVDVLEEDRGMIRDVVDRGWERHMGEQVFETMMDACGYQVDDVLSALRGDVPEVDGPYDDSDGVDDLFADLLRFGSWRDAVCLVGGPGLVAEAVAAPPRILADAVERSKAGAGRSADLRWLARLTCTEACTRVVAEFEDSLRRALRGCAEWEGSAADAVAAKVSSLYREEVSPTLGEGGSEEAERVVSEVEAALAGTGGGGAGKER